MTFNLNNKSQRFLGAASTLLKAMKSQAGMNSLIPVGVNAATFTQRYTLKELVDAMSVLIRLGLVPDRSKREQNTSPSSAVRSFGSKSTRRTRAANCGTLN